MTPVYIFIMILIGTGWVLAIFGYGYFSHMKKHPKPSYLGQEVVFFEKGASGYSDKSLFTKIGGAKNCLNILITNTELYVFLPGIFAAISGRCDLDHQIPLAQIESAHLKGKKNVCLKFNTSNGEIRALHLISKKALPLIATIDDAKRRGGDMSNLVLSDYSMATDDTGAS